MNHDLHIDRACFLTVQIDSRPHTPSEIQGLEKAEDSNL